jgi:hypothetical protein
MPYDYARVLACLVMVFNLALAPSIVVTYMSILFSSWPYICGYQVCVVAALSGFTQQAQKSSVERGDWRVDQWNEEGASCSGATTVL